jgi:hypothetical protein
VRFYRLHATNPALGQLAAGFELASLTDLYWRLARGGIATTIEHGWLELPAECDPARLTNEGASSPPPITHEETPHA